MLTRVLTSRIAELPAQGRISSEMCDDGEGAAGDPGEFGCPDTDRAYWPTGQRGKNCRSPRATVLLPRSVMSWRQTWQHHCSGIQRRRLYSASSLCLARLTTRRKFARPGCQLFSPSQLIFREDIAIRSSTAGDQVSNERAQCRMVGARRPRIRLLVCAGSAAKIIISRRAGEFGDRFAGPVSSVRSVRQGYGQLQ